MAPMSNLNATHLRTGGLSRHLFISHYQVIYSSELRTAESEDPQGETRNLKFLLPTDPRRALIKFLYHERAAETAVGIEIV